MPDEVVDNRVYKAVRKDLGTGSITGNAEQSYVVPYFVFTDNTTTPHSIYAKACSSAGIVIYNSNNVATTEKLPVFGTVNENTRVSDIKIERISDNNLIAVPQYGLASQLTATTDPATGNTTFFRNSSWTCWLYTVTFVANISTAFSSGDAPWESDEAISCTWTPKAYERYDNKTLKPNYRAKKNTTGGVSSDMMDEDATEDETNPIVPFYVEGKEEFQSLKNTVGDDLYRNRTVYNYLLNFQYATLDFNYDYLPKFLNTMNLHDCTVAGVSIDRYKGVINDMRVSQAEWNGIRYYTVDVEIEVEYQQKLTYDEYMSSGHRAYMIEGSSAGIHAYLADDLELEDYIANSEVLSGKGVSVEDIAGFVYKYTNAEDEDIKKYPVPIEELTDVRQRDNVPEDRWFLKKKNLGYFEGIPPVYELDNIIPRLGFLLNNGSLGDETLTISYTNPSQGTPEASMTEVLYYQNAHDGNSYYYSTSNITASPSEIRIITGTEVDSKEGTTMEYQIAHYTFKHSESKKIEDTFAGQYNSLQNPVALTKFGGVYFGEGEGRTVDDFTQYGANEIDMKDPMLGKVKDYQHVARDWSTLNFPTKGMFHTNTDSNNTYMATVTNYFK